MNRPGLKSGGLAQPLGSAAGRRAQHHVHVLGDQDAQDAVHEGRLAYPRTAGHDHDLRHQGQANGVGLAFSQRQAGALLDPGQRLAGVDLRPWGPALRDLQDTLRDDTFGPVKAGQKQARGAGNRRRNDRALGLLEVQGGSDQILRRFQHVSGQRA